MFLKLSEKSFIKIKPDVYIYSSFKDKVRSALVINESAFNILKLCDGTNSIESIITKLKNKYNSETNTIRKNVEEFLTPLIERGLVEISKNREFKNVIRGNKNIYYPDVMMFEITYKCPLDCKHCYLPKKDGSVVSKEDIDTILNLIDESGIHRVQITGGEALTHPMFDYIIYQLIQRKLIVTIATSGFILNEKILNCLKSLNEVEGSYVSVSLDGNNTTHNSIRGNQLSYDKTIEFLKAMVENKIPLRIATTIVNQSEQELDETVAKVKGLGTSSIAIGSVFSAGNAVKNKLISSIKGKKYNQLLKNLSDKYTDENFRVETTDDFGCIERESCALGHKLIRVKPNLDVTPCNLIEIILGNLKREPISEIMDNCGKSLHDLIVPCNKFCKDCENAAVCKNCPAQGLSSKNTVKKCNWFEYQGKIFDALKNNEKNSKNVS